MPLVHGLVFKAMEHVACTKGKENGRTQEKLRKVGPAKEMKKQSKG